MKIVNIETGNSYVNRLSINKICKKEENAMSIYKSLVERDFTRTSQLYITSASSVSSYIFIDGPVVVRWNWKLDKFRITELIKYPFYYLGVVFSYFDYFNDAKFLSVELNFTGFFKVSTPKLWSERRGLYLIPAEDSYVYSDVSQKKINISQLKRIYVDNVNLERQEKTGELLPNSCLPVEKNDSNNIYTSEHYKFFSLQEFKRVRRESFSNNLMDFVDINTDKYIENGDLVDKLRSKSSENLDLPRKELIQLLILNGLNRICTDKNNTIFKKPHHLNKYPSEKYPHLKGVSTNTVDDKVKMAMSLSNMSCQYSSKHPNTRVFNSLNIINACLVEVIIAKIISGYKSKEEVSDYLMSTNKCFKKLGLNSATMLEEINTMMTYLEK